MKNVPQKYSDTNLMNLGWPEFSMPFFSRMPMMPHLNNVSMWEEPNEVIVEVEAPGMNPEDIEMHFERGVLTIQGQRKQEKADEKKKFYQKANSSFVYRMTVPGDIDEKNDPKAELKEGLLQIRFKKSAKPAPKKISVQRAK